MLFFIVLLFVLCFIVWVIFLSKARPATRGTDRPIDDASLQEHITWYVEQGYEVQAQAETSARLTKPYHAGMAVYLYVEDGIVKRR